MAQKPSERRHYRDKRFDLNLTPMMNLVALLIPILLVSVTYIEIASIEAELPGLDAGGDRSAQSLNLRLRINQAGYILGHRALEAGLHHIPLTSRPVSCRTYVGRRPPPEASNGDRPPCQATEDTPVFSVYDRDALTRALVAIKTDHPRERGITISADDEISFEALVDALDASRSYEHNQRRTPLFDRVVFNGPRSATR